MNATKHWSLEEVSLRFPLVQLLLFIAFFVMVLENGMFGGLRQVVTYLTVGGFWLSLVWSILMIPTLIKLWEASGDEYSDSELSGVKEFFHCYKEPILLFVTMVLLVVGFWLLGDYRTFPSSPYGAWGILRLAFGPVMVLYSAYVHYHITR